MQSLEALAASKANAASKHKLSWILAAAIVSSRQNLRHAEAVRNNEQAPGMRGMLQMSNEGALSAVASFAMKWAPASGKTTLSEPSFWKGLSSCT